MPATKAIVVNTPHNPTGGMLGSADLDAIAEILERHPQVWVYADEIYSRLTYDGWEHTAVSSLPGAHERTILLNGFSKAYAMTGWRLGYACAPSHLIEAMMKVHQYVMMSAPTAAQYAAVEALEHGEEDVRGMVAGCGASQRGVRREDGNDDGQGETEATRDGHDDEPVFPDEPDYCTEYGCAHEPAGWAIIYRNSN